MAVKDILLVEDEEDIQELLRYNLEKSGFRITGTMSGEEGLGFARSRKPDLILLDLMLPDVDGLEVCRRLKGDPKTRNLPIVMLTARGEEADIVAGLELGADDYVTKPFSPRVLLARIRAVLRRRKEQVPPGNDSVRLHEVEIEPRTRSVHVKGRPVKLTFTEFSILHFLARRPGWVFTRYQIVEGVRGDDYIVTDRSVDVQIVALRRKLKSAGKHIETVRGVGYRFRE